MNNIPVVKLGLIAVSRDCFPIQLSEKRRAAIKETYKGELYECPVTVENEKDMEKALEDVNKAECNALVVFLGNFGPETPETLIAERFDGPCMYVAAAEGDMINGRGDAYCGMLNCSYNLKMRHLKAYIPEYPVGTADDIAKMIADFVPVARAVIGVSNLKIITFGPRPQDFFACNAPIKGLYELGVEIEENSELDLLVSFKEHENDPRIPEVCADMAKEMGEGKYYVDLNVKMAQFELTLLDWAEAHKGARKYVAFADKCWPAFPSQFGFEPCYVNSRLASRGIPVSCEVDIYGALSEFIGTVVSQDTVTLLDINNSVPQYIYDEDIIPARVYSPSLKSPDNAPEGCSSLQMEVYCNRDEYTQEELLARSVGKLVSLNILKEEDILFTDIRFESYANVIFDHNIYEARKIVRDYLSSVGIETIGRFGEWGYLWSDQSLMSGLKVEM